jgi:hypothetical protein
MPAALEQNSQSASTNSPSSIRPTSPSLRSDITTARGTKYVSSCFWKRSTQSLKRCCRSLNRETSKTRAQIVSRWNVVMQKHHLVFTSPKEPRIRAVRSCQMRTRLSSTRIVFLCHRLLSLTRWITLHDPFHRFLRRTSRSRIPPTNRIQFIRWKIG